MANDIIDPDELAEIMALPILNPEAPDKLGYPKELCQSLMENFFLQQFDEYIKNISAQVDSLDQLLMYSVAHKLVGSSSYAGAMRVNKITDKMQKSVPKEGTNPNFKRYQAFYKILMVEQKKAADSFDYYWKHGKLPEGEEGQVATNEPQAQPQNEVPPPPKALEIKPVVKQGPMKLPEIPKRVFPNKPIEPKPQVSNNAQEEPSAKLNLTYNSAIGGRNKNEQSGGHPPAKPNIQQMKAELLKQDVRRVPSVPPMGSTAYMDQPILQNNPKVEIPPPKVVLPPSSKAPEVNNNQGGGFVSQLDRVDSLFDKTINSFDENHKSEVKMKKDPQQKDMGEIVAAPSFNKLDKNCPQPAEPVEEQKIEKKVLAPTSGLKFAQKKKPNNPPIQINSPSPPPIQNTLPTLSRQNLPPVVQPQIRPLPQNHNFIEEEEKVPKENKPKEQPSIPKSPLSKLSAAGGKSKLKFNVHNQIRSTAGQHAHKHDQGYWEQLNEIRKKIVKDMNIDGEEDQYPFDDGWKCSIF